MTTDLPPAAHLAAVLIGIALSADPGAAQTPAPPAMPPIEQLRVLPATSTADVDRMLAELERAYAAKDVEAFVALFTEDVEQIDVNRRIHVEGREAWRQQTERVNAAHREMGRVHFGRAVVGDWVVVEMEWTGTVRGEALGSSGVDRSYRYSGVGLLELSGNKIRRQILYADYRTLSEQLGPPPGP